MAQRTALPPVVRGQWLPMTFEEFLEWAPDEGQAEWVDGRGIAYVSNSTLHAQILDFLAYLLRSYLTAYDLGNVFTSTALIRLSTRPSGRMPDIFIVFKEHQNRVEPQWFEGPADFVAEILSDEGARRDLEQKRREYEAAGVPEYLIVDGRIGKHVFVWLWRGPDGVYHEIEPDQEGRYHSIVLPGFWIDPSWLQEDPLPEPLRILKRISPDAWRRLVARVDSEE
jgi:Uma2 family endonuclease